MKIQATPHSDLISSAFKLFNEKWRKTKNPTVNAFLEYFAKNWTKEGDNGWYEGYCEDLPSTSNSLESTHTHMKSNMDREDKKLSDFLAFQHRENGMVLEWSLERAEMLPIRQADSNEITLVLNKNRKKYNEVPIITDAALIDSNDYRQRGKVVIKLDIDGVSHYFIPAIEDVENCKEKCKR